MDLASLERMVTPDSVSSATVHGAGSSSKAYMVPAAPPTARTSASDDSDMGVVAALVDFRMVRGEPQYLVRWADAGPSNDQWFSRNDLVEAGDKVGAMVARFEADLSHSSQPRGRRQLVAASPAPLAVRAAHNGQLATHRSHTSANARGTRRLHRSRAASSAENARRSRSAGTQVVFAAQSAPVGHTLFARPLSANEVVASTGMQDGHSVPSPAWTPRSAAGSTTSAPVYHSPPVHHGSAQARHQSVDMRVGLSRKVRSHLSPLVRAGVEPPALVSANHIEGAFRKDELGLLRRGFDRHKVDPAGVVTSDSLLVMLQNERSISRFFRMCETRRHVEHPRRNVLAHAFRTLRPAGSGKLRADSAQPDTAAALSWPSFLELMARALVSKHSSHNKMGHRQATQRQARSAMSTLPPSLPRAGSRLLPVASGRGHSLVPGSSATGAKQLGQLAYRRVLTAVQTSCRSAKSKHEAATRLAVEKIQGETCGAHTTIHSLASRHTASVQLASLGITSEAVEKAFQAAAEQVAESVALTNTGSHARAGRSRSNPYVRDHVPQKRAEHNEMPSGLWLGQAGTSPWFPLCHLVSVSLAHNRMRFLPSILSHAVSLERLDVSFNHIVLLPDVFHSWPRLASFDVSNNMIRHLPPSLGRCTRLHNLSARCNRLSTLPLSLTACHSLAHLNISGNPSLQADLRSAAAYPSVLPILALLHAARTVMEADVPQGHVLDVWATTRRVLSGAGLPTGEGVECVGVEFPRSAPASLDNTDLVRHTDERGGLLGDNRVIEASWLPSIRAMVPACAAPVRQALLTARLQQATQAATRSAAQHDVPHAADSQEPPLAGGSAPHLTLGSPEPSTMDLLRARSTGTMEGKKRVLMEHSASQRGQSSSGAMATGGSGTLDLSYLGLAHTAPGAPKLAPDRPYELLPDASDLLPSSDSGEGGRQGGVSLAALEAALPQTQWKVVVGSQLEGVEGLHSIDVSGNWLSQLPTDVAQQNCLRELRASRCRLGSLPSRFPSRVGATLVTLDISRNRLTRLPQTMQELSVLRRLDISCNMLEGPPEVLASLPSLEVLLLGDNPWTDEWMLRFEEQYLRPAPPLRWNDQDGATEGNHASYARPKTAESIASLLSTTSGGFNRVQLPQFLGRSRQGTHAVLPPSVANAAVYGTPHPQTVPRRGDIGMWQFLGGRLASGADEYRPPTALEVFRASSASASMRKLSRSLRPAPLSASNPDQTLQTSPVVGSADDLHNLATILASELAVVHSNPSAVGEGLVSALLGRAAVNLAAQDDVDASPAEIAALIDSSVPVTQSIAAAVSGVDADGQLSMAGVLQAITAAMLQGDNADTAAGGGFDAAALLAQLGPQMNPDRFAAAPLVGHELAVLLAHLRARALTRSRREAAARAARRRRAKRRGQRKRSDAHRDGGFSLEARTAAGSGRGATEAKDRAGHDASAMSLGLNDDALDELTVAHLPRTNTIAGAVTHPAHASLHAAGVHGQPMDTGGAMTRGNTFAVISHARPDHHHEHVMDTLAEDEEEEEEEVAEGGDQGNFPNSNIHDAMSHDSECGEESKGEDLGDSVNGDDAVGGSKSEVAATPPTAKKPRGRRKRLPSVFVSHRRGFASPSPTKSHRKMKSVFTAFSVSSASLRRIRALRDGTGHPEEHVGDGAPDEAATNATTVTPPSSTLEQDAADDTTAKPGSACGAVALHSAESNLDTAIGATMVEDDGEGSTVPPHSAPGSIVRHLSREEMLSSESDGEEPQVPVEPVIPSKQARRRIVMATTKRQTVLNLSWLTLRAVPTFHLPLLREIDLSHNSLSAIPGVLSQCHELRRLDLSFNKLSSAAFDKPIISARRLASLNLAGNELREIPPFVAQCSELCVLDVSENRLEHVDTSLLRLRNLVVVSLHSNPPLSEHIVAAASAGVGELWLHLQSQMV